MSQTGTQLGLLSSGQGEWSLPQWTTAGRFRREFHPRTGRVTGLSVRRCLGGSCQKLNPKSHGVEKLPVEMARMFFLRMGQRGWNGSYMVWCGKLHLHACNPKHMDEIFFFFFSYFSWKQTATLQPALALLKHVVQIFPQKPKMYCSQHWNWTLSPTFKIPIKNSSRCLQWKFWA